MSGDGPAVLLCFAHQLAPVEIPGLEHDGHVEEVTERLCVVGDLPVLCGKCTEVGAVHGREGCQLAPSHQQLLGAQIAASGDVSSSVHWCSDYTVAYLHKREAVYSSVAANVGMSEGIAREPLR